MPVCSKLTSAAAPNPVHPASWRQSLWPQALHCLQERMGQVHPAMPTQLNWYRGNSIVRGASQRTAVQRVRACRLPGPASRLRASHAQPGC